MGLALSALPNVGLALEGSLPVAGLGADGAAGDLSAALRATQQFLDDEDFSDDGFPGAGDWTQLDAGALVERALGERNRWFWRLGGTWFRARGRPNLVEEAGDYVGFHFGLGVRTRFSPRWSFGPELVFLSAWRDGEANLIGQIVWGLFWHPGA